MRNILTLLLFALSPFTIFGQARPRPTTPQSQIIGLANVWRNSNSSKAVPDVVNEWKDIRIVNIFSFKRRPAKDRKVTVVPLDVSIAPHDLTIQGYRRGRNCDGKPGDWWEVDLEPVKRREYFESRGPVTRSAEYPFDVVIIYPAIKSVHQIRRADVKKRELPSGVLLNTVTAALDLTGDGSMDALIVQYCCEHPNQTPDQCNYTCGKTFLKAGHGWRLIDSSGPC